MKRHNAWPSIFLWKSGVPVHSEGVVLVGQVRKEIMGSVKAPTVPQVFWITPRYSRDECD